MKTKGQKQLENPTKPNHCPICFKTILGSKYKFNAHVYRHNGANGFFECCDCRREFTKLNCYERHMKIHSGTSKLFHCDYCGRSFVEKRNLISHLRVHDDSLFNSPVNRWKCQACGVMYVEERLLKYHIRKVHYNLTKKMDSSVERTLNETWVEPVLDSKVFVQITKVNNNTVTIKKCDVKNECDIKKECDMKKECDIKIKVSRQNYETSFNSYMNSIFATEDKSQFSKAICDYCNKEMLKKSLRSHIRERHLKLRQFKCDVCKTAFMRNYQLVNHVCGKTRTRRTK